MASSAAMWQGPFNVEDFRSPRRGAFPALRPRGVCRIQLVDVKRQFVELRRLHRRDPTGTLYIDNLSEEVKKGMRQKAEEGHWPTPLPSATSTAGRPGRASSSPDPNKAHLVVGVFERCAAGMPIKEITEWAREDGLRGKRGGVVQKSPIHWILRNPIYAGEFWWDGTLYESRDPEEEVHLLPLLEELPEGALHPRGAPG